MADIVLGIEGLQSLVFGEIQSSIDLENAVLDANLHAALLDAGHLEDDVQCVVRLIDIRSG